MQSIRSCSSKRFRASSTGSPLVVGAGVFGELVGWDIEGRNDGSGVGIDVAGAADGTAVVGSEVVGVVDGAAVMSRSRQRSIGPRHWPMVVVRLQWYAPVHVHRPGPPVAVPPTHPMVFVLAS